MQTKTLRDLLARLSPQTIIESYSGKDMEDFSDYCVNPTAVLTITEEGQPTEIWVTGETFTFPKDLDAKFTLMN